MKMFNFHARARASPGAQPIRFRDGDGQTQIQSCVDTITGRETDAFANPIACRVSAPPAAAARTRERKDARGGKFGSVRQTRRLGLFLMGLI
jgi:hypothetical protein